MGEILTDTDFDRKYFDSWSLSFTKHCITLKFDGINFDDLAGKHQNFQLYGIGYIMHYFFNTLLF